jgi:hypothetical protein
VHLRRRGGVYGGADEEAVEVVVVKKRGIPALYVYAHVTKCYWSMGMRFCFQHSATDFGPCS